jgi:hypothetical protein
LVRIGAAEIKYLKPLSFGLLDRSPEQKLHAAVTVEAGIGAAVFISHGTFMEQGKDGRHWAPVDRRKTNLQRFSKTVDKVLKP